MINPYDSTCVKPKSHDVTGMKLYLLSEYKSDILILGIPIPCVCNVVNNSVNFELCLYLSHNVNKFCIGRHPCGTIGSNACQKSAFDDNTMRKHWFVASSTPPDHVEYK
jgi:hypothetical protein